MSFPHYHEDMTHLNVGALPNRAYFIPHGERDTALEGIRTASTRMTLLSGTWRFGFYSSVLDLPEDFFSPVATPDTIPVPSVWQCHGYDAHQHVNARFPIPYDSPYVPIENPCGLYIRTFHWSAAEDECATLHFEGVDSCMYVWVNEQFVGYSQVAHSTSVFDVTNHLRSGEKPDCRFGTQMVRWHLFRGSGQVPPVRHLPRCVYSAPLYMPPDGLFRSYRPDG